MARAIRRLRREVGFPARVEAVLGGKWSAVAVDASHCQSKLKQGLPMVGCQLVGMEPCPQQVRPPFVVLSLYW